VKETELLQALAKRDTAALEIFIRTYTPLMSYVVSPILADGRDREECISEISLTVWDKIHLYDGRRGSFTGWLTVIARNAALNRARKNARSVDAQQMDDTTPSPDPTPEEQAISAERRARLRTAVQNLPEWEQVLFYRRYYYRQSLSQIAAETGLSERACEGRLYRIKKKLAKELGGEWHD